MATDPHRLPPGIANYWLNGFNARTLRSDGSVLFSPAYDRGQTWTLTDQSHMPHEYEVPDHITVITATGATSFHQQTTLRFERDYQNTFTYKIHAGGGADAIARVSADSDLTFFENLFSDVSKVYEVSFFVCVIGGSNVPGAPAPLDPAFSAALDAIARSGAAPGDGRWTQFFAQYGTHYFKSGSFGGYFIIQSTIDKSILKQVSSDEVHGAFTGSFNSLVSDATLTVEEFNKKFTMTTTYQDRITTLEAYRGGQPLNSRDQFAESCNWAPRLLLLNVDGVCEQPTFVPLSTLAANAQDAAAVAAALAVYLTVPTPDEPGLSEPVPFPLNAILRATGDGFLAGHVAVAGDYTTVATADSPAPTGRRAAASASAGLPAGSFTVPVRSGDHYAVGSNKIPSNPTAPSVDFTVMAFPDVDGPLLGDWKDLTQPYGWHYTDTATSDGFVVVAIHAADGAPSRAAGLVDNLLRGACCIVNGLTDASFCMPVRKGSVWDVTVSVPGSDGQSVCWIPLAAGVTLGDAAVRQFSLAAQAEDSDGFLLVLGTGTGSVITRLGPTPESVLNPTGAYDRLAIAVSNGFSQSLLLPVPRGQWFGAFPSGSLTTQLIFWYPVTARGVSRPSRGEQIMPIHWTPAAETNLTEYVHANDRAAARSAVNASINAESPHWTPGHEYIHGANYGAGQTIAYKAVRMGAPVPYTVNVNGLHPVHAGDAAEV